MKSVLRILCAIILPLSMASCSGQRPVDVPNLEFYGDKGKYGATKVESLQPDKPGVRLPKSTWDELRIGMVCTPAANITTLQHIIDTLCAKNPLACNYAKEGVDQIKGALFQMQKAAVE